MITVMFFDEKNNNYYIGKKNNGKFIGFKLLLVNSLDVSKKLATLTIDLHPHEFLVLSVKLISENNLEFDPIVSGSLAKTDSEHEITVPLIDMDYDELLKTLNELLPSDYLQDDVTDEFVAAFLN